MFNVRHIWCRHLDNQTMNTLKPCLKKNDRVYMAAQLGVGIFGAFPFSTTEASLVDTLVKSMLKGMKVLKDNGIIHGNVTPKTLYVMSEKSGYAVVGDLGSAIRGERSMDMTLAQSRKRHLCAPELFETNEDVFGNGDYDARADMWSLGASIMASFGPLPIAKGVPISRESNTVLQAHIKQFGNRRPELKSLSNILLNLTHFDPKDRWSPDRALEECISGGTRTANEKKRSGESAGVGSAGDGPASGGSAGQAATRVRTS